MQKWKQVLTRYVWLMAQLDLHVTVVRQVLFVFGHWQAASHSFSINSTLQLRQVTSGYTCDHPICCSAYFIISLYSHSV